MSTQVIKENLDINKKDSSIDIDNIFEKTKKYMSTLEKNASNLLEKFGLKNNSYDGIVDETTENNIEKTYKNKVLVLKNQLKNESNNLRKQALVSKLINYSLEARGLTIGDVSKQAKDNLSSDELSKFSEQKNEVFKIKEQIEFQKELLEASKSLELNGDKSTVLKEETFSLKEVNEIKDKNFKSLEKDMYDTINKKIKPDEFTKKIEIHKKEAIKFNFLEDFEDKLGSIIRKRQYEEDKLGLSHSIQMSMESGIVPLALIITPGLKKLVPTLPAIIGAGIWTRMMHGNATDKAMAIGETVLYIAPITGTGMAARDTWIAIKDGRTGDAWANGVGTVVSAGFDVATVFLAIIGVGAPASVGSNALRVTAVAGIKQSIKKITSFFSKKLSSKFELNEAQELVKNNSVYNTTKEFFKQKITKIKEANKELGTIGFINNIFKQGIKETGEGLWSIMTFKPLRTMDNKVSKLINKPFEVTDKITINQKIKVVQSLEKKGIMKTGTSDRLKTSYIATAVRESNANYKSEQEVSTINKEENLNLYSEKLSSKNLDGILKNLNDIIDNNKSLEDLKITMDLLLLQDKHVGNSLNVLTKLLNTISEYNTLSSTKDGVISIDAMKKISSIEELIKGSEGKVSKGLYDYLERVVSRMKKGEDFKEGSANFLILSNKMHGSKEFGDKKDDPILKELFEVNGEKISGNGYFGHYIDTIKSINKINFGKLKGEKADVFIQKYFDMLKSSEKNGNGVIRSEELLLKEKGTNQTGYENIVEKLLNNKNASHIRDIIIKHIDLSLITKQELKEKIVLEGFNTIKELTNKGEVRKAIDQIKHLSFYSDYKNLLQKNINGEYNDDFIGNYGVIKRLSESTNSNRDLLVLLDFLKSHKNLLSKNKEKNDIDYLKERIISNIENNTQINNKIGKLEADEKGNIPITREELDNLFRDISKMGDKKLKEIESEITLELKKAKEDNNIKRIEELELEKQKIIDEKFKEVVGIIARKKVGIDLNKELSEIEINKLIKEEIIPLIESHDVAAKFCKEYPDFSKLIENYIINTKYNRYSIEYRIKFLNELEKRGKDIKELKDNFFKILLDESKTSDIAFLNKIDEIEYFFGKNDFIQKKIISLKNNDEFKIINSDLTKKIDEKLLMLVDIDRSFSDRYIKDLKNSGEVTHYTLIKLDEIIVSGKLKDSSGKILKTFSENDILKIKRVKEQVNEALSKYEFNLFDASDYQKSQDKSKYIFEIIDQMSGWKLTKGAESSREINRTILKQLNVLKNNFNISAEVLDKFLYEILRKKDLSGFNIESKIHLLKTLERTGVINPSVEQKLEYIIAIDAHTNDMRTNISFIKSYTKNFEDTLSPVNESIRNLKNDIISGKKLKGDMVEEVSKTLKERIPVEKSYLDGKNLREGVDYVIIDGKIYITEIFPSRYFITKMLETTDQKQKESYMELIHNKTDFGDKNIKDYFNDSNIDIHSKILLSYHDSIKYDIDVVDFLKKAAKTNPEEVSYALLKRKDFDIISSEKGKITEKTLDSLLTKQYIEQKLGKQVDDIEYKKTKEVIKKMLLYIDNQDFKNLALSVRGLDEVKIKEISTELNQKVKSVESLLESKDIINIITSIRSSDIYERDRDFNKIFDKNNINRNLDKTIFLGLITREMMSSPQELRRAELEGLKLKDSGANILDTIFEFGKEKINLKTILGLLIIKGLMTPEEAQAAEQRIGDQWKSSPEYDKYLKLEKAGSLDEAKILKEETITALTKEVLKDFILSFEEKYREKKEKEVNELPIGLQGLLGDIDLKIRDKLDKNHSDRDISKIKNYMINFVESIYESKGRCIKSLESILKIAPELKNTKIIKFLFELGKNYDESAKAKEESAKAKEESAKAKEESAKAKEESEARQKIGDILKSIN